MDFGKLFSNLFGGAGKALSGAGQTISQGFGGAVNAGANIGKNLFSGGSNPLMGLFGGGQQASPAVSTPTTNSFHMPLVGALGQQGAPGFSSVSMPGTGTTSPEKPAKKSFLDQIFPGGGMQGLAGMAAPAIGNMFAPKTPNIPDFNSLSSVQAMQNFRPGNSVSPEYQKMIQNNVGQLREQKVRELQALYHNARPGTDYLTDSAYQRDLANLDKGIQDNMTDELAKAEGTFSAQEQDRLSQLAQMDIYSIMAQTGMEAQEAQQFKEMFSNVGSALLTNATRKPSIWDNWGTT